MIIKVCPVCKGCGVECPTNNPCRVCGGSGYPPGYKPPTSGEVARWIADQL